MGCKKIRPLICIVISSLLVIASMTGCSNKNSAKYGYSDDKLDAAIFDLDDSAKTGIYSANADKMAILNTMTPTISNEYLELYVGEYYDIALLDKETNSIYFSNYGIYDQSLDVQNNEELMNTVYSQVFLTYFDESDNKYEMSSYPDCISESKQQIEMSQESGVLNLLYSFGEKSEDINVCAALTTESYEALEKKANKLIDSGDLDEMAFLRFTETYSKVSYDDLGSMTRDVYAKKFPSFKKLGTIYILRDDVTPSEKSNLVQISKVLGINDKYIEAETSKLGGDANSTPNDPYFEIPLKYELQGRDLLVTVDTEKVVRADGYKLTRISLLKSFGASDDSNNGYTFVPDRSGAIIEDVETNQSVASIEIPFYGMDFGKEKATSEKIDPYAAFPVFGRYDGTRAVFGVVESGEAIGGVVAQTISAESPYNIVYPWLNFYEQDLQNVYALKNQNSKSDDITGTNYVYMKSTPKCNYTVRYHFLYGDNATYSGMASYYQKYLLKTGALSENKNSDGLCLDLNVIGAITKKEIKLGIPVESVVAASRFEDVQSYAENLKKSGISNLNVMYLGAVNGGLDFKIPTKYKLEKSLGNNDDYNSLISNLTSSGYNFLPAIDFTRVYNKGNGLKSNTQISRYINQKVSYYSDYVSSDHSRDDERLAYIINPNAYSTITDKLLKALNSATEVKTLYMPSIASYLSGNYDDKYQINREQAKYLSQQSLEKLTEAGYELVFDGANAYALKYAKSISEVPVDYGNYSIESYAIPFIGMVLHGYMDYTGPQLNQQSNYKKTLLQTIESGAGLNYVVMTENPMMLQDTNYSDYYSVSADDWKDQIVDTYTSLNEVFSKLSDCTITNHSILSKGVKAVTYSNGTVIYINYNDTAVETPVGTIDALSFKVTE